MADVSLGGGSKEESLEKQKLIYLNIPTAILMLIDLKDSKNIKKYSDPIVASIKQSLTNKEIRKIVCSMVGIKTIKKFKFLKPAEFVIFNNMFGDIWGLNEED